MTTARRTSTARAPGYIPLTALLCKCSGFMPSMYSLPRSPPTIPKATDTRLQVPKRKPQHTTKKSSASSGTGAKPPVQPKKFCAFSASDSKAIECAYQKILESVEDHRSQDIEEIDLPSPTPINAPNTSMGMKHDFVADRTNTRVPVNEDFLFDVDIRGRELAPAYWLGPVYEGQLFFCSWTKRSAADMTSSTPRYLVLPRRISSSSL